jgi:hypothetical protein
MGENLRRDFAAQLRLGGRDASAFGPADFE